jgi:hypothetical protein
LQGEVLRTAFNDTDVDPEAEPLANQPAKVSTELGVDS